MTPLVVLTLTTAIAQEDLEVAADGTVAMTVGNQGVETGTASIRVRSRSELDWAVSTIAVGEVAAGDSREVSISAADLDLARGSFDHSGSITLVADLELERGRHVQSRAVHVFFHPTESGWRIYDRAGRLARHDDGALTVLARAERAAMVAELGEIGAAVGRSPVRKISESARFVPANDVPVDSDEAR